ncbi:T9SS type A sorting domain-containing protein [uncultured Bacteroides sp.]|uniref:T9SS type A sorting domain-containing protein n=1 Tax=uncultured Bacteroides sp. TaxID=162156 RepID=UPI002AAABE8C|nr:T9SS type A sorting domain-containing protein [uncultured Bacteroides sp.]
MKKFLLYFVAFFFINNINAGDIEHFFVKVNQPDSLKIDKKEFQANAEEYYLGDYVLVSGGTAPYFYRWTPESIISDPTSQNPYWKPNNNNDAVNLTVTDSHNCIAKTELKVTLTDINVPLLKLSYSQTRDYLLIYGGNNSKTTITVINSSGNIISIDRDKDLPFKVNLTSFNDGIYIVKTECLEGAEIFKIIIDK